jgi:UDP-N-acetylmuramoylalanine--D-glutamate ligase
MSDTRRIGILGMARSGMAVLRDGLARGAQCLVYDDSRATLERAVEAGGMAGSLADVRSLDALVVSPGVPLHHPGPHPVIVEARRHGIAITSDVDLFAARLGDRPVVGVTGTNGKSTTTALIHHLLREVGRPTLMGGNIGLPVLDLELGPADETVVLELSSYQLDLARALHARVAVLLNITPDHLDRHGTFAAYVEAKKRLFDLQPAAGIAIIGVDDAPSVAIADTLEAQGRRVIRISASRPLDRGVYARGSELIDSMDGTPRRVADLAAIQSLEGRHNRQNAAAAYATLRALGIAEADAVHGFATFQSLPHRMATVARAGRVRFVDDSKATNPEAAIPSLSSFADIFWIAGGRPKPGGFAALLPHLQAVRGAWLIGEAADEIAATLPAGLPREHAGELERALPAAYVAARAAARASAGVEPVVLLAPACASFDQFANYEARGDAFAALARELAAQEVAA